MKKLVFIILACLLFNACGNNDEEYLKNIKSITFNSDEIYFANNVEDLAKNICMTWVYFSPVDKRDLKWSIEEVNKEEKSKLIKCEYRGNKIFFMTYYDDEGYSVNLSRSYTVSQMGWQNTINEIANTAYPNLRKYFE